MLFGVFASVGLRWFDFGEFGGVDAIDLMRFGVPKDADVAEGVDADDSGGVGVGVVGFPTELDAEEARLDGGDVDHWLFTFTGVPSSCQRSRWGRR